MMMTKARYIMPDGSWILVDVLEKSEDLYRVIPVEWIGISREEFYAPVSKLEFLQPERTL